MRLQSWFSKVHPIPAPERDPETFFGFWGSCYNSYFDTEPHDGYHIVRHWRDCVIGQHLLRRARARCERARHVPAVVRRLRAREVD